MRRRRPWRSETRRFLSRLPELPSLRYDDGQSLASEATQLWLAGLSQGTVGAVALAAVPPSQEDSHTAAAVAEAMDILDSQGPVEALRRLESALGPSATGNARLRCQELRILCGHGASKAAAALGRALRLDMERDRLVELKPDLARRGAGSDSVHRGCCQPAQRPRWHIAELQGQHRQHQRQQGPDPALRPGHFAQLFC